MSTFQPKLRLNTVLYCTVLYCTVLYLEGEPGHGEDEDDDGDELHHAPLGLLGVGPGPPRPANWRLAGNVSSQWLSSVQCGGKVEITAEKLTSDDTDTRY